MPVPTDRELVILLAVELADAFERARGPNDPQVFHATSRLVKAVRAAQGGAKPLFTPAPYKAGDL